MDEERTLFEKFLQGFSIVFAKANDAAKNGAYCEIKMVESPEHEVTISYTVRPWSYDDPDYD